MTERRWIVLGRSREHEGEIVARQEGERGECIVEGTPEALAVHADFLGIEVLDPNGILDGGVSNGSK